MWVTVEVRASGRADAAVGVGVGCGVGRVREGEGEGAEERVLRRRPGGGGEREGVGSEVGALLVVLSDVAAMV